MENKLSSLRYEQVQYLRCVQQCQRSDCYPVLSLWTQLLPKVLASARHSSRYEYRPKIQDGYQNNNGFSLETMHTMFFRFDFWKVDVCLNVWICGIEQFKLKVEDVLLWFPTNGGIWFVCYWEQPFYIEWALAIVQQCNDTNDTSAIRARSRAYIVELASVFKEECSLLARIV